MPAFAQAASFNDILASIQRRLVTGLPLATEYVRRVANDQYQYAQEETLVALRPLGPTPSTNAGGGRDMRPESRTVRVYLSKRSSLDQVGDDTIALAALFALENQVNDLLDEFLPQSETDLKYLTIEPLHPTDSSSGPPVRQAQNDVGEVLSMLAYEVVYVRPNTMVYH